ncbi:hypothetical protein CRUP_021381 [Coryphaenoides rupestris]|nr:hypothetical protein CRUP_021381 [Coryphaenoides rupestris]
MNFVGTLVQILFAAALHISSIKTASINKEDAKTVTGAKNEVVPFLQVFEKSVCQSREVLVDIYKEYPDHIEHRYTPSCVVVKRCSGFCNDEAMECVPTRTRNVTMMVLQTKDRSAQHQSQLTFLEHEELVPFLQVFEKSVCQSREVLVDIYKELKPEVKTKKEKGKGQKRKRKKQRDTAGIAEAYASYASSAGYCEPCSERRKRLYVQDPLTYVTNRGDETRFEGCEGMK